jgi:outer membrane protein
LADRATANNIFGQLLPQSVIPSISGPVLPSSSDQGVWGSAAGGLFSWEPVDFGLRSAIVREAEAGVVRARAEEELTRLAVQNAVGGVFLAVVSAQQALTAADADVQRREVLARAAHTLVDNQLRPGAEASRADAELAAARTRAIQAGASVMLGRTTLARMLGIADGQVGVNTARLLDDVVAATSPAVPASPHPLLQSEQAAVDLARAREMVLTKTDRPRLYLQSTVSARGSGANPDGVFDGGADGLGLERANWAAGVQVVFPNLFDFSTLRSRRAAAGALTRAESARYDEAVLTVTSQQRAADAMVDAARAVAQNTPIQLTAAQQSEAQARARYDAGLAGITEVAEAQNLLAGAEYQDAAARVEVWRALLAKAVAQGDLASFVDILRASGVQ